MWLLIITVVVLIVAIILFLTSRTFTSSFFDNNGKKIKGSIAEEVYLDLGGIKQWVLLRGVNKKNPLLVLLHGGPGASVVNGLYRYYNNELENHFVVVYWEQRGTGRSYDSKIYQKSMTLNQFVSDLHELIGYLKNRFMKNKVYLMGESWGSLLGILYAQKYPEDLTVYIGIGQISNTKESELLGYEFTLAEARRRNNKKALRELQKMGSLPGGTVESVKIERKWLVKFGGLIYGKSGYFYLLSWILKILSVSEYAWPDLLRFSYGSKMSLKFLWDEIFQVNLFEQIPSLEIPVYFLIGCHDHCISSALVEEYFEYLKAPFKKLIWFEKSGHNPPWEESERFNKVVISQILKREV